MTTPDWENVAAIAEDLLDLDVAQREAELVRRCGGDAALESAVRKLVGNFANVESGEFLKQPAFQGDALAAGLKGTSIGGFDLLEVLGEGGMGVVFEARQRKPERNVAVKVLRPVHASRSAIRRFEIEAEILGRLHHPAIASVIASGLHRFSGGELGFELPWYAMELLKGSRDLLRYAREERLSLEAKLGLFARVCEAVHYAHQRGVIHRDLKPANLLVDATGLPKVIDFGIAHTTDLEGTRFQGHSSGTRAFDLLGTLRYMAPEQVDGRADQVDVRTDVYALGVVLFELLTGASPLAVDDSTLDEALRAIRHAPPRRPRQLIRELPRELDWVVDKCLAKEPSERYDSVAALMQDLERLRRREVLSVGPPDLSYRVRTFVRRNRIGVTIGAIAISVLIGWIVSLDAALDRARIAEGEASTRAAEAQSEAEKLRTVRGYFAVAIDRARGSDRSSNFSFRSVIDQMEDMLDSHPLPPEIAANVCIDVAEYHLEVEQSDRAIALLNRALEGLKSNGMEASFEARRAQVVLARAEDQKGDVGAAEASIASADAIPATTPSERLAIDLEAMKLEWERVRQMLNAEQFTEAEGKLREMLKPFELGASDPGRNAQIVQLGLGLVLASLGKFAEAETLARKSLAADIASYGEDSSRAANSATLLASIRRELGFPEEAIELIDRFFPALTEALPPTHRYVLAAQEQRALAKQALGAYDEALAIFEQTLPLRGSDASKLGRDELLTISRIARVLVDLHRYEEAEQRLRTALDESEQSLGEGHVLRRAVSGELGRVLVLLGRREEGQPLIAAAVEHMKSAFPAEHPRVAEFESWLEKARAGTLTAESGAHGK